MKALQVTLYSNCAMPMSASLEQEFATLVIEQEFATLVIVAGYNVSHNPVTLGHLHDLDN